VGKQINKDEYKYIMKKVDCKTIEHLKEHRISKIDDTYKFLITIKIISVKE
jgi:hypothetical protein